MPRGDARENLAQLLARERWLGLAGLRQAVETATVGESNEGEGMGR